eukprot:1954720-Prymnesium_polylepis.1
MCTLHQPHRHRSHHRLRRSIPHGTQWGASAGPEDCKVALEAQAVREASCVAESKVRVLQVAMEAQTAAEGNMGGQAGGDFRNRCNPTHEHKRYTLRPDHRHHIHHRLHGCIHRCTQWGGAEEPGGQKVGAEAWAVREESCGEESLEEVETVVWAGLE